MRGLRWIAAIVFTLLFLGATDARALTLQSVGSFNQPIYVTSDPGDPGRLFVIERRGLVKLVQGESVSVYADLTSLVDCPQSGCVGESGLMSMAFDPDFATSKLLYVAYVNSGDGTIHIDELTEIAGGGTAGFSRSVLDIPHGDDNSHNGGQIQFGPDERLYISTGDGGGSNGQFHHSQNRDSLLGKILRIDPEPSPPLGYTVPPDNPFSGSAQEDIVWALGLRNPFRFSFDRLTGGMAIGDVGQEKWEEVNWAPNPAIDGVGANYGWNCREGLIEGPATDPECPGLLLSQFTDPTFSYPHDDPGGGMAHGCSVIGGYVVRDPSLDSLYGRYVYTDFCTGDIRSVQLPATASGVAVGDRSEGLRVDFPVSLGEDAAGGIYVVSNGGGVYRLCDALDDCLHQQDALPQPPPAPYVGIRAERRRVRRRTPALIIAWISPCGEHRGTLVRLLRDGRQNGTKYLSRACTVRFHPRIHRRTVFKAELVHEEDGSLFAESRRLIIKIDRRRHRG